jgi:LPXTG-motif cell wall-anchored protein
MRFLVGVTEWGTTLRRMAFGAVVALVVAFYALVVPQVVVACLCSHVDRGDVVFIGTVTDSPNRSILLRDVFEGAAGVYTFDVDSVTRGDPKDGRVYTPAGFGGCGRVFELGATYRVHAEVVTPDDQLLGRRPGVALATGTCMEGELLDPPDQVVAFQSLIFTPQGIGLMAVGLGLVAGTGIYARRRRRSSEATPSEQAG